MRGTDHQQSRMSGYISAQQQPLDPESALSLPNRTPAAFAQEDVAFASPGRYRSPFSFRQEISTERKLFDWFSFRYFLDASAESYSPARRCRSHSYPFVLDRSWCSCI